MNASGAVLSCIISFFEFFFWSGLPLNSSSLNELESIAWTPRDEQDSRTEISIGDSNADVVLRASWRRRKLISAGKWERGLISRETFPQSASSVVDVAFGDLDGSGTTVCDRGGSFAPAGGERQRVDELVPIGSVDTRELSIIPCGATRKRTFSPSTWKPGWMSTRDWDDHVRSDAFE